MREREREIINYMYVNIMGIDICVKIIICMLVNGMCIRYYCKLCINIVWKCVDRCICIYIYVGIL